MSPALSLLRFAWWNVYDFAHFDANRMSEERWPRSQAEYDAKCARVDAVLRELISRHSPDVLGMCEITQQAAEGLRQRVFPNYRLVYPTTTEPFQVAVLFRNQSHFHERLPLPVERGPSTNRPMLIVDHRRAGHHILFVFCHWTAFGDHSKLYRERAADTVTKQIYTFLREPGNAKLTRHAVVIGDLNEEPFSELITERLIASRDRAWAMRRPHRTNADVKRARLYNPTWRLLGEQHPHGAPLPVAHHAGTYFHAKNQAWHTYDQLLVSGSLLTDAPPFLDEASFEIMVLPGCLGANGLPEQFEWNNGHPTGLSDHLPLVGRIALPPG